MSRTCILYVDPFDFLGGAETGLATLVRNLDSDRFFPVLAGQPDSPLGQAFREVGGLVEWVEQPALRGLRSPWRLLSQLNRVSGLLTQVARRHQARLIHSNVVRGSLYAAPAALRCGIPHVWHIKDLHMSLWYRILMGGLSQGVIAMSEACLAEAPSWARGRARVIADGVDLQAFDPESPDIRRRARAFRERLGVSQEQILIGNAAWFARWKGQHLFVEACRIIAAQRDDCRFVALGAPQGSEPERYFRAVAEQGAGLVSFPGLQEDMPAALGALDLFINASLDEPFGRVLIEAMAMGLPVVSHASGGPRTIVSHGETGRLVGDYTPQALAAATLTILESLGGLRALGAHARQRALDHFSARAMAERVEAFYDNLLRGRPQLDPAG